MGLSGKVSFVYSKRDREAIRSCQALSAAILRSLAGFAAPRILPWSRSLAWRPAILTSVSSYIFLKLRKTREKIMDEYLGIVKEALAAGIVLSLPL